MKDFVFKCWLCFLGGEKLFCLFICNKIFTALLPNEWGSMCSDFYKQNWKALSCYCMIIHSVHVHSQLPTPTMATSKSRTSGF